MIENMVVLTYQDNFLLGEDFQKEKGPGERP